MRAIWAIFAAIAGLVIGYLGSMLVIYPLIVHFDGLDRDGGIAMGVAFTIAPVVALVTAVLAAILVLKLVPKKVVPPTAVPPTPEA